MKSLAKITRGQVVAIDGKTLRRSFDRASNRAAIHMVSAWASEQRMVLGQVKTDDKSNEITAIPKLLDLLDVRGCIVTIDAMGCQREIARKIVERGADYVLQVKGNQGTLEQEVSAFFEMVERDGWRDIAHDYQETVDGEHGRIEVRRYYCTPDVGWFEDAGRWVGLRSFGMVESERTVAGKTTTDRRLFISSLPGDNAEIWAHAIRAHWTVENCLHWCLDVAFREDDCRVRRDNAAANFAMVRHIAMNLLKQETSSGVGIKNRRLMAGWDEAYLVKVLGVAAP